MAAKVMLWRWRRNPLRRGSDVAQAWIGLATVVVMAVGAPLAAGVAASGVESSVLQQARSLRATAAVLVTNAPEAPIGAENGQSTAQVRWTGHDGAAHTDWAQVVAGAKAGSAAEIWLDGQGRTARPPMSRSEAAAQSQVVGGAVAVAACGLALAGRRAVVAQLDRRRARDWERAWAQIEPRWSHGRA
jgi:hypothetical protein